MSFQDIIGHATPIAWLRSAMQSNHLAHAYLLIGDEAIGKRMTAMQCIQAMNCDTHADAATPDACETCRSCQQIMAHIHPDVLFIQPDEGQGQHPQIKIERVREIEHHMIYRPLLGPRKICLIDNADRLTIGAANALLKTLEEPPDHCLFLLITSRPSALLTTLKSRCLTVRFSPPSQEQAIAYLMEHRGFSQFDARFISFLTNARLGEAMTIDLDATKAKQQEFFSLLFDDSQSSISAGFDAAEALSKSGHIPEALLWLWTGLRDILLVTIHAQTEFLFHEDHLPTLRELAQRTSPQRILELLDTLHHLEQGLQRNLNSQLRFEQFFLQLREAIPPA